MLKKMRKIERNIHYIYICIKMPDNEYINSIQMFIIAKMFKTQVFEKVYF